MIRKIWISLNLPCEHIWYRKNVSNLDGICVVMDAEISVKYLNWLAKQKNNKTLKFFYWNTIEKHRIHYKVVRELGYDIYSFDPKDCERYGLKLNREFYCDSWYNNIRNIQPDCDIVFIGRDKNGRMKEVQDFVTTCDENISWTLHFTANKWYQRIWNRDYSGFLKFGDMLKLEMRGKAILDFAQDVQSTITCRTYDALVNGRKVITNNSMIMELPYYNPQDIFVIGKDDLHGLKAFIDSQFQPIDKELLEEHSASRWSRVLIES